VAQSLAKRDGFTTEHSYLLWIDHVLSSVHDSASENRVVVDYDLLMSDPQHQLQRMSKQLGLPVIDSELAVFKNEFLDEKLRHTAFTLSDLQQDSSCPAIVTDCYQLLLEAAKDNVDVTSESFKKQISQWHNEHVRNRPMLQLLDERWNENTALERHLKTHRERIVDLNQEKNSVAQEVSQQRANSKRLESEVDRLESARSALESRTHDLVDQLGRETAARNRLTETLNKKERDMIEVRNSTSWRLTAPIRWARERLFARK